MLRRSRSPLLAVVLLALGVTRAVPAGAVTTLQCTQADNTLLVCHGNPCIVSQDFRTLPPAGCDLDFGTREVIFRGNFDVGSATLTVHAGKIRVEGAANLRAQDANGA